MVGFFKAAGHFSNMVLLRLDPGPVDIPVCPGQERRPIRGVGVPAVVLPPRDFTIGQCGVYRRHRDGEIIIGNA